jgi:hypothetical protein
LDFRGGKEWKEGGGEAAWALNVKMAGIAFGGGRRLQLKEGSKAMIALPHWFGYWHRVDNLSIRSGMDGWSDALGGGGGWGKRFELGWETDGRLLVDCATDTPPKDGDANFECHIHVLLHIPADPDCDKKISLHLCEYRHQKPLQRSTTCSLFGWLVADGWCWFVLRREYCWLVAGGWFVVREKYCWLVSRARGLAYFSVRSTYIRSAFRP